MKFRFLESMTVFGLAAVQAALIIHVVVNSLS
jgi:hypothetical protein